MTTTRKSPTTRGNKKDEGTFLAGANIEHQVLPCGGHHVARPSTGGAGP